MVKNNNTPVVEEVRVKSEEEIIAELREQLDTLKIDNEELEKKQLRISELETELVEEKRHASRMDEMAWKNWMEKERVEKERNEKDREKEQIKRELEEGKVKFRQEEIRADNLQQELNQIRNQSPRENQTNSPGQSFYNGLQTNIFSVDNNNVSIKPVKRSNYPALTNKAIYNSILLNILEKTLDLPLKSYGGKQSPSELVEKIIASPVDVENITSHLNSNLEQIFHYNKDIRKEYEKLFIEGKNSIN